MMADDHGRWLNFPQAVALGVVLGAIMWTGLIVALTFIL